MNIRDNPVSILLQRKDIHRLLQRIDYATNDRTEGIYDTGADRRKNDYY
jgi:hypothetical protein